MKGESQGRGNSGVFLMGRYEIQVLDSFRNPTYADGQAAAMYGQIPPLVNACRKPGEWQSYDILFKAPRFQGDKLESPGVVTLLHNGVAVHHADPFIGATAHREVGRYEPHPPKARSSSRTTGTRSATGTFGFARCEEPARRAAPRERGMASRS